MKRSHPIDSDVINKCAANLPQTKQTKLQSGDGLECMNLMLLDWDNTLMPTSYLLSNIDYELDEISNKFNEFIMYEDQDLMIKNLEKVGQSTFELLTEMLRHLEPQNIKIITNGEKGWLPESLFIAGIFCKIYTSIRMLLNASKIEIVYARDYDTNPLHWKSACIDSVLSRSAYDMSTNHVLNTTTVGDQWHDHDAVRESKYFCDENRSICHNQIKLVTNPDCRYQSVELKYITFLIQNGDLFKDNRCTDGLSLEFDGYNE
eukprot:244184_1